jgi:hypothetical protein
VPWLLRPVVPASALRLDETMAFHQDPTTGAAGATYVTSLGATFKLTPRWVPVLRAAWVKNDPPAPGRAGSGFTNLLLGVNYLRPFGGGWRGAGFLASTVPVGSGGGDRPEPGTAGAMTAGIPARSGMDNALFATSHWTVIVGAGLARVTPALTVQAELSVLRLTRVRGPQSLDAGRTNLTVGLHLGRFFGPRVSVGGEVRLQRWLTEAAPVRANPAAREQLTFGLGPRFHLKLGRRTLRAGISYTRALDDPMAARGYDIVQLDLPLVF